VCERERERERIKFTYIITINLLIQNIYKRHDKYIKINYTFLPFFLSTESEKMRERERKRGRERKSLGNKSMLPT